eukprot:gnl/MRDRNA2_/MRDRNA2_32355_c0_seq1.p1 gnl/MRDRNA2_/MRDRNA2_32355_c0~~gnl/MRDRNA2_/MRDRNA2_32355_c0_seq1.p1  ORF type:complete len:276 (+),score=56.42 gnl/MRDRNA2_/MRDRNA2_32355_c0_seq1:50-877(+)
MKPQRGPVADQILSSDEEDEELSEQDGWISWFVDLKGHDFFVEVEEEYIRDNFNLYGLRGRIQYYDSALEMILSSEVPDQDDLADVEFLEIYRDAADLYGLIHARYIVSPRGLQFAREKYLKGAFGTCPRVLCDRQHVLPVGVSEELRSNRVKIYCPRCEQVYSPKSKHGELDGAYFGVSFPQIFLQSYPGLLPLDLARPFIPRIFGFKVHEKKSLVARRLEDLEEQAKKAPKKSTSNMDVDDAKGMTGSREATVAPESEQAHNKEEVKVLSTSL